MKGVHSSLASGMSTSRPMTISNVTLSVNEAALGQIRGSDSFRTDPNLINAAPRYVPNRSCKEGVRIAVIKLELGEPFELQSTD